MIITGKKFSKPDMSRVINGDTVLPTTPTAPEKFRLDHLLVEKFPNYNRSSLQTFIKSGFVSVNGQPSTKPNAKFLPSADIVLSIPETASNYPEPEVIYEDANILVVNKPAGLLTVAKGEYCPERTLADYGLIVHRLDRGTSGVVILAKNQATQTILRKQFQDRKTHKTYYAITSGHPKLPAAFIDLPIARNIKHPTTFIVDPAGKPSQTNYRTLASSDKYSLLELKPISGRTHQLRVHLKYLGTPILGDTVYNPKPAHSRLFLHAGSLEITIPHPTNPSGSKQRRTFTAPLPSDFLKFFPDYTPEF